MFKRHITIEIFHIKKILVIDLIGYYIYTEASLPRVLGDKFVIQSPYFYSSQPLGFTFWYHRFGESVGQLEIYDNSTKIGMIEGDTGDVWLQAIFNISSGFHRVKMKSNILRNRLLVS